MLHHHRLMHRVSRVCMVWGLFTCGLLVSCSTQKKISRLAATTLLNTPETQTAHVGIAVFDVSKNKYLYQHNSNKYFIPASNTKLLTCYAAMKYLGDSLAAMQLKEDAEHVYIFPTGDPSLLMDDFTRQPAINLLRNTSKQIRVVDTAWHEHAFGLGWTWDDYNEDYMPERSLLPVYGNVIRFAGRRNALHSMPMVDTAHLHILDQEGYISSVQRNQTSNSFTVSFGRAKSDTLQVPFITDSSKTGLQFLSTLLHKPVLLADAALMAHLPGGAPVTIYSQPTDTLLSLMMHRSDNFFAEQTLLMLSNKLLSTMNDRRIIDTLLATDYKDFPQAPQWVDGSGLSRFNLLSPEDFVFLLNKMRASYDWKRITAILPTGGKGTISSYYKEMAGRIFVKTGTLSNNVALSGFLITRQNHLLIFSVLVNNHHTGAGKIRHEVESFLKQIDAKY